MLQYTIYAHCGYFDLGEHCLNRKPKHRHGEMERRRVSDSDQGPLPPRTRVIWGNREQSDTDLRENGSSH